MDILNWAALIAVGVKVVSTIKLRFPGIPPWAVQCLAWGVGIVLVFLGSEMQVVQDTSFNEVALADMSAWTKVGIGVIISSAGSLFGADTLTAIDRNRTTSV